MKLTALEHHRKKVAMRAKQTLFLVCAVCLACGPSPGRAADVPEVPLIKENEATTAVLDLQANSMTAFRVEVPKDAVLMAVKITRCPVVLEILARKNHPIASVSEAQHRSNSESAASRLFVSRQTDPPLDGGIYYVSVAHTGFGPLVVHKRPVKKVSFTVTVSFVRAKISAVLKPGERTSGQTRADEGSVQTFVIDVPERARALRIDLDHVSGSLDILARHEQPILRTDDADDVAVGELGRKTLLIDQDSPRPLKPGRWYVNLVHPADSGNVDFAVYACFSPDPPPPVLAIPEIPRVADGCKRAVHATVDVATEMGGASGTLLTDTGLILTNYHVVEEVAEGTAEKDPVIIGATLDPREPARELFRGKVIAFDRKADLALVQVTCGLYRQPLPKGYRFPWIPLGDPATMEIGDRLATVGFPEIGSTNGRPSVTLTQGVVSGFEKNELGTILKTDASISPGSSGGAALNGQWRLIGVPTSENVSMDSASHMSYIHPISLMPEAWRKMIREHHANGK